MCKMTTAEFREADDSNSGFCTTCDEVTNFDGVEPDAEGYECEECGENTVMGMSNALLEDRIDIVD